MIPILAEITPAANDALLIGGWVVALGGVLWVVNQGAELVDRFRGKTDAYATRAECDLKMQAIRTESLAKTQGIFSIQQLDDRYTTRREWEQFRGEWQTNERKADKARARMFRRLEILLQRTAGMATTDEPLLQDEGADDE